MNYFLIAGEASGDLHAGNLIRALQQQDPNARFTGLGGDKMQEAGCRLVRHYRDMAFMGVLAVIRNISKVQKNFRIAHEALLHEQPDVCIFIDYPSFNLRMASFCKKHLPNTRTVYYIPPKVWAWKSWRIHKIARLSDLILGIFPFEETFYQRYGYTCRYVGNPTMDSITAYLNNAPDTPSADTVVLLPGSRRSEITHCLPRMLQAARDVAKQMQEKGQPIRIVVTAAPGVEKSFYTPYLQGEELTTETYAAVRQARAAIVNSGTATLETALLGCPQTAVYHVALSRWLGFLKPLIFRIPHFTLVNIIPQKEVIQELVAYRFTKQEITAELMRLLTDNLYRRQMMQDYRMIADTLGKQNAADTAAKQIIAISPIY